MDLSTTYMGLALRNPLVASPSPLSYTLDGIRRVADAGVGAVVMYSLFEEQVREEAARNAQLVDAASESFAEALDFVPAVMRDDPGTRPYLRLLERAASAVDVPVIASLNGVTPEGWTDYARDMEIAGAAAIELNIYYLPGDPHISGRDVEQRHIDVLERVKAAVAIPVAVKLSPYFSSIGEMALRLDDAGPTRSSSSTASSSRTSTPRRSRYRRRSRCRARPTGACRGRGSRFCVGRCARRSRPPAASRGLTTWRVACSRAPTW